MRKRTKVIAAILIGISLSLLSLEGVLRAFDPMGILEYQYDMWVALRDIYKPNDARPYVMPDGRVELRRWTYTIKDGIRITPDTNLGATCHIVATGDSLTFGFGVNDAETWPNVLAKRFFHVRFTDAAHNGYNVWDNTAVIETLPADGYIYLVIRNDDEPTFSVPLSGIAPEGGAITTYALYLQAHEPQGDMEGFRLALDRLKKRNDVLMFSFAVDGFVETLIPEYTGFNSRYDHHPNATGHRQIADSMYERVKEFIRKQCRQ